MKTFRLGLIGGNITQSRSPALQILCAMSVGQNASYDLLVPEEQGLTFEQMLARCGASGFDGVNVTYPYKERVLDLVNAGEPALNALGAANTVCFTSGAPVAWNTDHTGFIAAWRDRWNTALPGVALVIGAGGVGRAVTFALAALGASEIILVDADEAKAAQLAREVSGFTGTRTTQRLISGLHDLSGIDGIVNGTPLGMNGRPGSALPANATGKPTWAFDAVYTPEQTLFRSQVTAMGADFLSGYELYFHQGVQGFKLFSGGLEPDAGWIRSVLARQGS